MTISPFRPYICGWRKIAEDCHRFPVAPNEVLLRRHKSFIDKHLRMMSRNCPGTFVDTAHQRCWTMLLSTSRLVAVSPFSQRQFVVKSAQFSACPSTNVGGQNGSLRRLAVLALPLLGAEGGPTGAGLRHRASLVGMGAFPIRIQGTHEVSSFAVSPPTILRIPYLNREEPYLLPLSCPSCISWFQESVLRQFLSCPSPPAPLRAPTEGWSGEGVSCPHPPAPLPVGKGRNRPLPPALLRASTKGWSSEGSKLPSLVPRVSISIVP